MSRLEVFVSSTVRDLKPERQELKEVLDDYGFETFVSESESSKGMSPSEVCLKNVSSTDIFILIIGEEYGYIPPADGIAGSPYDGNISVTHGEFLKAREFRKPILVFVKDVIRNKDEEAFLNELGNFLYGEFYTYFKNVDELRLKLKDSIAELLCVLIRDKYIKPWKGTPNVFLTKNASEVSIIGAKLLGRAVQSRPNANVGLFASRTANDIYFRFFQMFKPNQMENLVNTHFFSVTEHFGVSPQNSNSYYHWFQQAFFDQAKEKWGLEVPEKNKHLVPSIIEKDTMEGFRIWYDQYLQINKVDIQLISPAPDGQILCIDPNYIDLEQMISMGTSLVRYSQSTSKYLVPMSPHDLDIVIGIRNLLERSERLAVFCTGKEKKDVVKRMILGPIGNDCPASLLSLYPREDRLIYVLDSSCSQGLPKDLAKHVNVINNIDEWFDEDKIT